MIAEHVPSMGPAATVAMLIVALLAFRSFLLAATAIMAPGPRYQTFSAALVAGWCTVITVLFGLGAGLLPGPGQSSTPWVVIAVIAVVVLVLTAIVRPPVPPLRYVGHRSAPSEPGDSNPAPRLDPVATSVVPVDDVIVDAELVDDVEVEHV